MWLGLVLVFSPAGEKARLGIVSAMWMTGAIGRATVGIGCGNPIPVDHWSRVGWSWLGWWRHQAMSKRVRRKSSGPKLSLTTLTAHAVSVSAFLVVVKHVWKSFHPSMLSVWSTKSSPVAILKTESEERSSPETSPIHVLPEMLPDPLCYFSTLCPFLLQLMPAVCHPMNGLVSFHPPSRCVKLDCVFAPDIRFYWTGDEMKYHYLSRCSCWANTSRYSLHLSM